MSTFCTLCQNVIDKIFVRSLYQNAHSDSDASSERHSLVQRFAHVGKNQDICSSAEHCSLCSLIKDDLYDAYLQSPGPHCAEKFESSWLGSCPIGLEARGGNRFRTPPGPGNGLQLSNLYINTIHGYYRGGSISIYAEKESPAAISGDVLGIGPLNDSSSDDSLSVLRTWVAECALNHDCGRPKGVDQADITTNPEFPTRVLDISTDGLGSMVVRLVESRGMRGRYAALSHCWGPPDKQPLRTTKATYNQHLDGFPASGLPKTFREAVIIARAVGIRYIWIDSLCIIQDDLDDWSSESPRMGQLYSRAYLVIAASAASNSTEGCFLPRPPLASSLRIPYPRREEGKESHVVLAVHPIQASYGPGFSPLGKRGWVLQEWQLARRLAHFTAKGMSWSCKRVQDMGEDGNHSDFRPKDEFDWDSVIESYTARRLTYLSDKLVAVQGMAEAVRSGRENAAYYHGMWTCDMPQQLFWVGQETCRPRELQDIPSWSWASTNGRCSVLSQRLLPKWETLGAALAVENDRELVISCRSKGCRLEKWKAFSHSAVKEPPFSEASVPVSVMFDLPVHFTNKMTHLMIDEETGETIGLAMLDDVEAAGERVDDCISASLMKEVRDSRQTQAHCLVYFSLILESVRSFSGTYRRLGVGFVIREDWVQRGAEQTLRII